MESRKIADGSINAAAEWWKNRISGKVEHDNGDSNFGSVFAGLLADDMVKPASNAQLQKFKNNLVMRLSTLASQGRDSLWLDCDYSPDMTLSAAAADAGIPRDNFPWKVSMRIDEECVTVKNGYGAPWVRIWPIEHKTEGEEGAA